MTKRNILYINLSLDPLVHIGGINTHAIGIINAFQKLGYTVTICSYCKIPKWKNKKVTYKLLHKIKAKRKTIKIIHIFTEIYQEHNTIKQILKILKKNKFDLIYFRWPRNIFLGKIKRISSNIPLIMECNTPLAMKALIQKNGFFFQKCSHWMDKQNLALSTLTSTISLEVKNFLIQNHHRKYKKKIIVNPNGVDVKKFQSIKSDVRRKFKIPPDAIVIGFTGAMYRWQGVDILLSAFKDIQHQNFYLLLVGQCLDKGIEKELNKVLKIDHSRVIITGAINYEMMPQYLAACDILVSPTLPSYTGGFHGSPTKVFEYMAMGTAIIASNIGQTRRILDHQHTALLIEPGNTQQLIAAIQRLADDRKLREYLGKNARKEVVRKYTWDHNVKTILNELKTRKE